MPFSKFIFAIAVIVSAGISFVCYGETAADETIEWLDNYPRALEHARSTGKPILLAFRCVP